MPVTVVSVMIRSCMPVTVVRDWSLITGRAAATKREGRKGGTEKVLAMLRGGGGGGGTTSFGTVMSF